MPNRDLFTDRDKIVILKNAASIGDIAAFDIETLGRSIVMCETDTDSHDGRCLRDASFGKTHNLRTDTFAPKARQHVEINQFRNARFTEWRIVRSPVDRDITRECLIDFANDQHPVVIAHLLPVVTKERARFVPTFIDARLVDRVDVCFAHQSHRYFCICHPAIVSQTDQTVNVTEIASQIVYTATRVMKSINPMFRKLLKIVLIILAIPTIGVTIFWQVQRAKRPPRTATNFALFEGVTYERRVWDEPRPVMLHIVTLDRAAANLAYTVTPPDQNSLEDHLNARTTSQFLAESGAQLAINASYFYPFRSNAFFDYYPHVGDPVTTVGFTMADGAVYSPADDGNDFVPLCFGETVLIADSAECPANTTHAVAGNPVFLRDGRNVVPPDFWNWPMPRTAVAFNDEMIWFILADGRQRGYSEGIGIPELAELALELGATDGIALDGGGSVTLAVERNGAVEVLNSPIHARMPLFERPIGNHIGVFAPPLSQTSR